MLDDSVRWGGEKDTPETCHSRTHVLDRLARQRANGLETQVIEVVPCEGAVLLGLRVKRPVPGGFAREQSVYQVLSVSNQRVVDIRGYPSRPEAAARAGIAEGDARAMQARQSIPILNVSSLVDSFEWFARLGWVKKWDWQVVDGPATFGAVGSGQCEVFLCLNGQGGRGTDGGIDCGGEGAWVRNLDPLRAGCGRVGAG